MSRQITISRTELSLSPLNLNDPTNGYFVSDDWKPGGVMWERYESATSPFSHGSTVVAQRKLNVDEIFTVYVFAKDQTTYTNRVQALRNAFAQFRYTVSVTWDYQTVVYDAVGAGDIQVANDTADPVLHRAGWHAFQITFPRQPK